MYDHVDVVEAKDADVLMKTVKNLRTTSWHLSF